MNFMLVPDVADKFQSR